MLDSPHVDVFYPVYKNVDTFSFVLDTCLRQNHKNIRVHIFDNAYAEGYCEVADLISGIDDPRIIYKRNFVNIGPAANYRQIFSEMKKTKLSICLASDIGFTVDGLTNMLSAMSKHGASVVFSSSKSYKYADLFSGLSEEPNERLYSILSKFPYVHELTQPGHELIEEYFSAENICGEYNDFSFFGSLIYSPILNLISDDCFNYRFHGFEHYLSMDLAINAMLITRLRVPCMVGVLDSPRIGGTERPLDHYTRFESIAACDAFLRNKYPVLKSHFNEMKPFFISQAKKCEFFRTNYIGYDSEINRLHDAAVTESFL